MQNLILNVNHTIIAWLLQWAERKKKHKDPAENKKLWKQS